MSETLIEWTNKTWNPTTGCDKVSRGCKFCYADSMAKRLQRMGNRRYQNGFALTLHPDKLDEPLSWRRPAYVFVNSMSDLFHPAVPDEFIFHAFATMHEADHHVYQVLTKRADRLARLGPALPWADHIWMGVSVEDDEPIGRDGVRPTDRIDLLRRSGATFKWLSCEPLVGPLPELDLTGIDWVVIGGESRSYSGADIDALEPDWVRDLIAQCRTQNTLPFVKQLGTLWAEKRGSAASKGGRIEEWPEDIQVREVPLLYDGQPRLQVDGAHMVAIR